MSRMKVSRRAFLAGSAAIAAGCRVGRAAQVKGRVIILGFDGVKPGIVDKMFEAGELPNLAKLRDQGSYHRLGSSNPPQSPTAWSSFATCKWPGNHGIYDFLRRNPENYLSGLGFGTTNHAKLAPDGSVAKDAEFVNFRKGETFWALASDHGMRCKLLEVPYAYPADKLHNGRMLCGLDVPDIRGTQSTFFAMSEALEVVQNVGGGVRLPLKFKGKAATVRLPGFRNPETKEFIRVPVELMADRAGHKVTVTIQGQKVVLAENTWSDWFEWTFEVTPQFSVRAISRVHVLEAGELVRLYMTCLQCHPRAPYVPISYPNGYAAELADRYGLYKTIGWAYDTKALERDDLTEPLFLEDVRNTMTWRETLMLDELDRGQFDLLAAGWTGTDRVGHMFWRFRDTKHPLYTEEGARKYGRALEDTYVKMDEIVGKAMAKLDEGDLLMVMSDHGFHSFRYGFSVNTWLVRHGYLAIKGKTDPATASTRDKYLMGFDWPRTKAYALGLGSVFLNLKGREGQGTVAPQDAPALVSEIREKLLQVTDPETGDKVLREVYTNEIYKGESEKDAPDLQLGYAEGYQTNKSSAAGGAPAEMLSPNVKKWSGEHAASDVAVTHGILFSNRSVAENPAIVDVGATALKYLGIEAPGDFEGASLI